MDEMSELKVLKKLSSDTGFVIVPIHYTHDPDKVSDDWYFHEQAKYRRDSVEWENKWNQEMELDFTTVAGAAAYPGFSAVNVRDDLIYNPSLPICLCCDFNVEPMVWEIVQVVQNVACFIDEIYITPADVSDMVQEFRNRYPSHPAEIWVYGDATGRGRTAQTKKSYYDLLRLAFRGYTSKFRYKVPVVNPSIHDRLNAFNLKLRGVEGNPGVLIDEKKCPELLKDLAEVVKTPDGGKIVKIKDRNNPYFWRTHASDSGGYFIYREWPTIKELTAAAKARQQKKRRHYQQLLGEM
jgi:hypothetical protein